MGPSPRLLLRKPVLPMLIALIIGALCTLRYREYKRSLSDYRPRLRSPWKAIRSGRMLNKNGYADFELVRTSDGEVKIQAEMEKEKEGMRAVLAGEEEPCLGLRCKKPFGGFVPTRTDAHKPYFSDKEKVLNGHSTKYFRDNLRNDTHYLTTWTNAGFTNQFMGYANMIYLATLTDRVPIIPPFAPDHHISPTGGIIPFGDFFDLEHLSLHLRLPILEWRDVKSVAARSDPNPYRYGSQSTVAGERIGCWSTRVPYEGEPIRAENVVNHIGVDASYTRVPSFTRIRPDDPNEPHMVFSQLAALVYPRTPLHDPSSFPNMAPSPGWVGAPGHNLPPEDHLACFDTMYYTTSGAEVYEWRFRWDPVWRTVGKHLRFTKGIEELGKTYLRAAFGLLKDQGELPPFIAVHVRRGDFKLFCNEDGVDDCYPSLEAYNRRVEETKAELLAQKGLSVDRVVVMSDERSPEFWREVAGLGWDKIDHDGQKTVERFGEWYPAIVDVVAQSLGIGFVGTEDSTLSLMSERRVVEWNGGVVGRVNVRTGE